MAHMKWDSDYLNICYDSEGDLIRDARFLLAHWLDALEKGTVPGEELLNTLRKETTTFLVETSQDYPYG